MEYLAFFTSDHDEDEIVEWFHKTLELAENIFLKKGDIKNYEITKFIRENAPTVGLEH